MKKRRVLFFSADRSDFGLLSLVIEVASTRADIEVQVAVGGSQSDERINPAGMSAFGLCDLPLDLVGAPPSSYSGTEITSYASRVLSDFGDLLSRRRPDLVVLLGDRYETHAAGMSSVLMGVPIAHIHGGEVTNGAIDDAFRHSLTKMSSLHFVVDDRCAQRVLQLGEEPARVFVVGALGWEAASRARKRSHEELSRELDSALPEKFIVVTYHPETLAPDFGLSGLNSLLEALSDDLDLGIIFTRPNPDPGREEILKAIEAFCSARCGAVLKHSLGQDLYLSLISRSQGVVGNSSSGLLEAPALGAPTLNIGERQSGRTRHPSVIDVDYRIESIRNGLSRLISEEHRQLSGAVAAHLVGVSASSRIVEKLTSCDLNTLRRKLFVDWDS